jgi:hypothetical protein
MGCLKKLTICATGGLSAKPDQLKKWIEANDGRWTQKMSRVVTHLVASETAWKTENEAGTSLPTIPVQSYPPISIHFTIINEYRIEYWRVATYKRAKGH